MEKCKAMSAFERGIWNEGMGETGAMSIVEAGAWARGYGDEVIWRILGLRHGDENMVRKAWRLRQWLRG